MSQLKSALLWSGSALNVNALRWVPYGAGARRSHDWLLTCNKITSNSANINAEDPPPPPSFH